MTTKQTEALLFIQQGLRDGHIKCSPYIETTPNAEQIEIKSLHTLVDEALKDADEQAKEIEDLRQSIANLQSLISDDAFAITFQSMGQYRTALLRGFNV